MHGYLFGSKEARSSISISSVETKSETKFIYKIRLLTCELYYVLLCERETYEHWICIEVLSLQEC